MAARVGIIGCGFIGSTLANRVIASDGALELAFVHNRTADRLSAFDPSLHLSDLAAFYTCDPDLIVEASHPVVTAEHGTAFLSHCDYMPLSTTALLDDGLRERLTAMAADKGTRLILPSGALIGGNELAKRQTPWKHVKITFRKNPRNIDFEDTQPWDETSGDPVTLADGPVREIARQFPRNVNTMVTCALLSTGLDACQGVLVADPGLDCAIAELEAWDADGGYIRTEKRQPAVGVSGTEMVDSAWYSLQRAAGLRAQPLTYV
ncbi:aspartate dehydrogenase domain-containing protein [Hoeflea sp.]|uniref:aspartate dehydrogenase domain-containing protein n=1 Tax=Hoeflea sp. TaxID=1940281 RepID=UPI003B02CFD0